MIVLTCGHEVPELEEAFDVIIKDYDKAGDHRALSYRSVCNSCKESYKKEEILFDSEPCAYAWLLRSK